MTALIILIVLLAVGVAVFLYRLAVLFRGGTAAILRVAPAAGGAGWRHGVIRYDEGSLLFFKLSSIRPGPDSRIERQGIEVEGRRAPEGSESEIMNEEIVILSVRDGDREYEIALDGGGLTAFLSWVESRPSGRWVRNRRP